MPSSTHEVSYVSLSGRLDIMLPSGSDKFVRKHQDGHYTLPLPHGAQSDWFRSKSFSFEKLPQPLKVALSGHKNVFGTVTITEQIHARPYWCLNENWAVATGGMHRVLELRVKGTDGKVLNEVTWIKTLGVGDEDEMRADFNGHGYPKCEGM
jgi:hypothetical protein